MESPVTNSIKVLKACFCKSVNTGLFVEPLLDASIVKFNMFMLVFTFLIQNLLTAEHNPNEVHF